MVERLVGTNGDDILSATSADDFVILGRGGDDQLFGGSGADRLLGGRGNDTLASSDGQNVMLGGPGNDVYLLRPTANASLSLIVEEVGAGRDEIRIQTRLVTFSIPESIEHVRIEADVDFFWGNEAPNVIDASTRFNGMTIDGGGGADIIRGSRSHDLIDGGTGADRMVGGAGFDTYYVDHRRDTVVEAATPDEFDSIISSVDYRIPRGVEFLGLAGRAAAATGNDGDNSLSGNGRANTLAGLGGADSLFGGGGADTMTGGAGADFLLGGTGRDDLEGGAGADLFVFIDPGETGRSRRQADFVRDLGRTDLVDFTAIDANAERANEQAFVFIGSGEFSATAGELRYDGRFLAADRDGDGSGDFFIRIAGDHGAIGDNLVL